MPILSPARQEETPIRCAAHSRPRKKNIFDIMLEENRGVTFPGFEMYLCGCARSQRLDRFLFGIVHFEDRQQLGDLEQIAHALRQIR